MIITQESFLEQVKLQKGSGKKENDWAVRKMNVGQRPRYPSVKGRVEY